jgi:hypothetical protein
MKVRPAQTRWAHDSLQPFLTPPFRSFSFPIHPNLPGV